MRERIVRVYKMLASKQTQAEFSIQHESFLNEMCCYTFDIDWNWPKKSTATINSVHYFFLICSSFDTDVQMCRCACAVEADNSHTRAIRSRIFKWVWRICVNGVLSPQASTARVHSILAIISLLSHHLRCFLFSFFCPIVLPPSTCYCFLSLHCNASYNGNDKDQTKQESENNINNNNGNSADKNTFDKKEVNNNKKKHEVKEMTEWIIKDNQTDESTVVCVNMPLWIVNSMAFQFHFQFVNNIRRQYNQKGNRKLSYN